VKKLFAGFILHANWTMTIKNFFLVVKLLY